MISVRLKAGLAALLMCSAAALAHIATPREKLADIIPRIGLSALFPTTFDDWVVDDSLPLVLPSPDVQAKLDRIYNEVLTRTYANKRGQRIMLSVAYGGDQSDGTSAHKPEVCYPAQGFQISSKKRRAVDIGYKRLMVRQLEANLGSRFEPITYWIVVGNRSVTSATEQKVAQLRFGIQGLIPDGMLVRVSSIGRDSEAAFEIHEHFIRSMVATLGSEERIRIAGLP